MSKSEYDKLLNKPQWKLKRQVIFKRDNYTCTTCGSKELLCVHHTYYYKRPVNPWGYPDDSLVTLCETCHNNWHKTHKNIFIDNLDARKPKSKKKIRQQKKSCKNKPKNKKKHPSYTHKEPNICWAQIQAHRNNYVKTADGTWYPKHCVPKK